MKIMPLTVTLLDFLGRAGFRRKRFKEVSNGEISFAEGSYEDVVRYSKVLRNMGFKNYTKIENPYLKGHSIENEKYKITIETSPTLKITTIKIKEL